MANNKNLHTSRAAKTDEFYTQTSTIEDELYHYRAYFKDKVIFCNCDDPYESNFFRYFALCFKHYGIKKLIATCYIGSPIASTELTLFDDEPEDNKTTRVPHKIEITESDGYEGGGAYNLDAIEWLLRNKKNKLTRLNGDGDFRSDECLELLKECDIVVTNPPFSLMKEYLPLLVNSGKQFIILGNTNHITLKEATGYFLRNQCWLGYNAGHFWFMVPEHYEEKSTDFKVDETGQKWRRMGNCCWFTNIDVPKRHTRLDLFASYSPDKYPKYDDFDAIECGITRNIPLDYEGVIGVPISYMAYHCPEQFEIVDLVTPKIGGKLKYKRLLIKSVNNNAEAPR